MREPVAWLEHAVGQIGALLWGGPLLVLMLAAGVYFSLGTGFFQLRRFGAMLRCTLGSLGRRRPGDGVSPFQAMTTALAGTLGVGNIVGVATALAAGGPGAVFWMWISAFLGMMTKYAEVLLAVKFRRRTPGGWAGGPMYYLRDGLGSPALAGIFCIACVAASYGIGNMTQANAIAGAAAVFSLPAAASGLAAALLTGLVMLGGFGRIAAVTGKLVPVMGVLYLAASAAALAANWRAVPQALGEILAGAFSLRSAAGGAAGYTMLTALRYGVSRGIFSNEAGLGSAPIAHSGAQTADPARQGLWGMFEVFFDTIVMCTVTTLVILTAGGGKLWHTLPPGQMTAAAFSASLGPSGEGIVSVSVIFFALSTLMSWSLYGERALEYLGAGKRGIFCYRAGYLALIAAGALVRIDLVWGLADLFNGLMAIPNLIAVFALSPAVFSATWQFERSLGARGRKKRKSSEKQITYCNYKKKFLKLDKIWRLQ